MPNDNIYWLLVSVVDSVNTNNTQSNKNLSENIPSTDLYPSKSYFDNELY